MQQPLGKNYPKSSSPPAPLSPSPANSGPDFYSTPSLTEVIDPSRFSLDQIINIIRYNFSKFAANESLLSRTWAHLSVILLIALALSIGSMQISWGRITALRPLRQTPANPSTKS